MNEPQDKNTKDQIKILTEKMIQIVKDLSNDQISDAHESLKKEYVSLSNQKAELILGSKE